MKHKTLGEWMLWGRRAYRMTEKELGDHVNVSPATISDWEAGRAQPDREEIGRMSELFGPSPSDAVATDDEAHGRGRRGIPQLDPHTHQPIYDLLKEEREKEAPVRKGPMPRLARATVDLVEIFQSQLDSDDFWSDPIRRARLRGILIRFFEDTGLIDLDRADRVADRLMELAKANHHLLIEE